MTVTRLCCSLLCTLCLMAMPAGSSAQEHEHAGHSKPAATVPVPTQRWAADAPLREGMGRVRQALDGLHEYELGRTSQAAALEHVTAIQDAGTYIFTHCKLAPDADAALHAMLVPLLGAAQTLKNDPHHIAAVAAMRAAVADYPRYFDDPGWPALATPQTH